MTLKKMKKAILICSSILVTLALIVVLRPVSVTRENCKNISGIVTEVTEGGVKDVVIILAGHNEVFYINRGLENGFKLTELIEKFKGKEITISFAKHWTPLEPRNKSYHIAELRLSEELVYSEF